MILPTAQAETDITETERADPSGRPLEAVREICRRDGIDVALLLSDARSEELTEVRREIAAMLRREGYGLKRIGAALNRHHSTIVYILEEGATSIVREVCDRLGVNRELLLGTWQTRPLMDARREVAKIMEAAGYSRAAIGRAINRSRSDVVALLVPRKG